jgi:TRAP-type C4-dicarboxylate transport system permease small subunit
MGRILDFLCKAFALAGGGVLAVLALMSVVSIGGRIIGRPIQGDFELVQFGCAIAIAFFLPYSQLMRANIIVDFFTVRATARTRHVLDAGGSLLLAATMALLAWRTGAGTLAMQSSGETSMIMGVPLWYAYAAMTPGFGLAALTGLYTAWLDWAGR